VTEIVHLFGQSHTASHDGGGHSERSQNEFIFTLEEHGGLHSAGLAPALRTIASQR